MQQKAGFSIAISAGEKLLQVQGVGFTQLQISAVLKVCCSHLEVPVRVAGENWRPVG